MSQRSSPKAAKHAAAAKPGKRASAARSPPERPKLWPPPLKAADEGGGATAQGWPHTGPAAGSSLRLLPRGLLLASPLPRLMLELARTPATLQ